MLKESVKVKLTDWLLEFVPSHHGFDTLVMSIDLDPSEYRGTATSGSLHARIISLIEDLSNNPKNLLKLINSAISRYNVSTNDLEELQHILIGTNLCVDIEKKKVIFCLSEHTLEEEAEVVSLLEKLPCLVNEYIEKARKDLEEMNLKECLTNCRRALEAIRGNFITFIKELERDKKISPIDRSLMEKVYGYLSELGPHPALPDMEQALLGYSITKHVLLFLIRKRLVEGIEGTIN